MPPTDGADSPGEPPELDLPQALRVVSDAAKALDYYKRLDPLRALESAQRTIDELNQRLHRSTAEQLRLRFDLDQAEHFARTLQNRCEAVTLELEKLRSAISQHLTDT